LEETLMSTLRMLAFVAAVLITGFFFRVMAYGFTVPQPAPARAAASAHATGD
jgi:hypothetical protein